MQRATILLPMLNVLFICLGASAGALARWRLGLWLSPGGLLPWGTLVANWVGGYGIGLAVGIFQIMPQLDPVWRMALITGLLGALTTFSSFSIEIVELLQHQRVALALGSVTLHLVGSIALTWLGLETVAWAVR